MAADEGTRALPCPSVRLPADYRARLERCTLRVGAALDRREGAGRSALAGAGLELVGHRPYREGDDPRAIDWNLYARLERPYVKVSRREARERWLVLVDASASMGVGPPGKLQRAAEVAGAIAWLGVARGAEVELARLGDASALDLRTPRGALERLLAWLESSRASGVADAASLAARKRSVASAARVFAIGDPFAYEPGDLFGLAPRGARAWHVVHVLAPIELVVPDEESVEWLDPESDARVATSIDGARATAYARALEARLERWARAARARGARAGAWSSERAFEDVLREALGA